MTAIEVRMGGLVTLTEIINARRIVVRPKNISGKGPVENVKALKVLVRNQSDNVLRNSLKPSVGKRGKTTKKEAQRVSKINW